jgi:hypothetical protein
VLDLTDMAIAAVLDTLTISKRFEDAGFTKQQADLQAKILVEVVESNQHEESIKHEIDASESRLEKTFIREISELRKEMLNNLAMFHERFSKVDADLRLIKGVGALIISVATLAGTIFSVLHIHLSFT